MQQVKGCWPVSSVVCWVKKKKKQAVLEILGAGGVQSIAKKSEQKTVLTNIQEELDRMTQKPDSMVTNSSTENEAWSSLKSAYVKWPNNYVYWSSLRPGFFWYGTCYQFFGAGEMNLKKNFSGCPSVKCTFRKVVCQTPLWWITLGLLGVWLSCGQQVQLGLLWKGR